MLKQLFLPLFLLLFTATVSAQKTFPLPKLADVQGQEVDLATYVGQGKPTVIAVWATWCQPCHMELNEMQGYVKQWEEDYGAQVLAISVDKRHMVKRIQPLVGRKGWDYNILVDTDGQLQTRLGFRSIPQMYVVDGDGKIIREFSGYAKGRMEQVEGALKRAAAKR